MDKPGEFNALNAAVAAGAEKYILDYGSSVSAEINGSPLELYFVVKRLF